MAKLVGHRRLHDPRLLNAVAVCPDDGRPLQPTGDAYSPLGSASRSDHWRVAFRCPLHPDEIIRIWSVELQPLLAVILGDTDIDSLPIVGPSLR
jgi:hypothetical protein